MTGWAERRHYDNSNFEKSSREASCLQAIGVQKLSSLLSHVVPLLNKVLSRYGLAVASCERKACQAPAQPYLDQQDYLLVGVSATSY
ncbi:MAG: hypothetical protein ACPIOQ_09890 [Promethearchaeia archaeon]